MGASLGAIAVVTAAPRLQPEPDGVISLSGPDQALGMDGLSAVRDLSAPILLVATEGDPRFRDAGRNLYRASRSTEKTIKIMPGFDHGTDLLRFDQAKETEALIFGFLKAHLGS
jgi:hypothetical protein